MWKHDTEIIDFSCNINPLGPPNEIPRIIHENINKIVCYPDDTCTQLKSTISNYLSVPEEHVIVGCGSTELIKAFAEAFVRPGDRVLVESPTYDEYAFYCRVMGGVVDKVSLGENEEFRLSVDSLFDSINTDTRAVFICNPNNPTSRFEPKNKILEVVEECESRNILVFVDEAFIDFVGEGRSASCIHEVQNYDNLFVSRSLTKIFSIPGIRVGYGLGSKELVEYMDKTRLSWSVGVLEQFIASELLKSCDSYLDSTVKFVEIEKRYLYERISSIEGYEPLRPDANFLFIKIAQLGIDSTDFKNIMLDKGFLIRDCRSFGEEYSNYIRIGVKNRNLNDTLLEALKEVSEISV